MRCAIYARYSSDMQRRESIQDQVRQCRRFIEGKGWTVEDGLIFSDHAVTGTDDRREGYLAMKTASRERRFDFLVVDDLSRLGRHSVEVLTTYEELMSLGLQIVCVADSIDTSMGNAKMPLYFKTLMNEIFLDDLREKVRRGQSGQISRGYSAGGRLYGYKYIEELDPSGAKDRLGHTRRLGVRIEIQPDEAETIKLIFRLKAQGLGLKGIAHQLNVSGISAPRNNRRNAAPGTWCTSTVRTILRNPKYIGDWAWGRTKWVKVHGTGKRVPVKRSKSDWVANERPELRIIDQPLWERVQANLNACTNVIRGKGGKFRGSRANTSGGKYLFSGLMQCGKCGGSMVVASSGRYSSYTCNNNWNRGKAVCDNNRRISRASVESDLLSGLQRGLLDDKVINRFAQRLNKRIAERLKVGPAQSTKLAHEATDLEREIENLSGFIVKGDTSERIRQMLSDRESKLARLRLQMDSTDLDSKRPRTLDAATIRNRIASVRELLNGHADRLPQARHTLSRMLGDKIRINPLENGAKWDFEAEAMLKPGRVLDGGDFQWSVIALRGFEPRFDG